MQPLRRVSDEVFVADAPIVRFGGEELAFVKRQALASARRRARICAHRSNDDALHEMLIAISADSYIHPHKHTRKVESFHIVAGTVDVVVFEDDGRIADVIELGDASTDRSFYYRLADSKYHTLLIHGELLVVHEVTNGPFNREETKLAPFAPPETERDAADDYRARLAGRVQEFLVTRRA